jgi:predicted short-subunit dehydrogenase-like oxidoreductase (DUF2520 family)
MKKKKKIVVLGSGNVASHLAIALSKAGHTIVQVYSPTLAHARSLAIKIRSAATNRIDQIHMEADIYLLCVSDHAIPALAKKLRGLKGIVLHTSGTTAMLALNGMSKRVGVIYPLQTFSRSKKVDFSTITWLIESGDVFAEKAIKGLISDLGGTARKMDSVLRLKVHMAAVFACNFSNHCYALAEKLLGKDQVKLSLLMPLIEETVRKLNYGSPLEMQTGPALRGDKPTMQKHLQLLKNEPELKKLYELMSRGIAQLSL